MKICYLANAASIHTQRWARHFSQRSFEVTVISFEQGEIEGIKVIQIPPRTSENRLNILLNLGKVRNLVKEIDPDILHAHYVTSYGLAGAISGRHPLVMTAWGSDVFVMPEKSRLYRRMVRFSLSHAELITSMADHMTQHLVEKGYADAQKIVTLPFGVDTEIFNLNRRSPVTAQKPPLVLSTRRLVHELDVHIFLQAIPYVLESGADARFVFVGDGPLRVKLAEMARDLGIAKHVTFRGEVTQHQMAELLGQADVFVSTSPTDGNNISLNEAMACGAFPVATDIPANRTWITNEKNGLLFASKNIQELAEKIIKALRNRTWREATAAENWVIVKNRGNWKREMARMEGLYEALLR